MSAISICIDLFLNLNVLSYDVFVMRTFLSAYQMFVKLSSFKISIIIINIDHYCSILISKLFLPIEAIKQATSDDSFGDKLPEEYLKDAEELYHLRIPERFRKFAGNSSPPYSWTLLAWIADLQARFTHMEKILYQV